MPRPELLEPLQAGTDLNQALRFHSRERRRSLAGVPELFRTHQFGIPTTPIAAASFPVRDTLVTFQTSIRIVTGVTAAGLVFELGDSATAVAAWIDTPGLLSFRAGDALAADRGLAAFNNGGAWPDTLELDLVFAVRPGDGRVRIWANGEEIARDTAANGQLPLGWAASSNGSFASAAVGALPADVLETGAPTDFDVIQPLSVYVSQVPRHFI